MRGQVDRATDAPNWARQATLDTTDTVRHV